MIDCCHFRHIRREAESVATATTTQVLKTNGPSMTRTLKMKVRNVYSGICLEKEWYILIE